MEKPGLTLIIAHHFYWRNLCKIVQQVCSKGDSCQWLKCSTETYGKLPLKEAEVPPWDTLCVDVIDNHQFTMQGDNQNSKPKDKNNKYSMETKNDKTVFLQSVTMIDSAMD